MRRFLAAIGAASVAFAFVGIQAGAIVGAAGKTQSATAHLTLKGHFTPSSVPSSGELAPDLDQQTPPHQPMSKTIRHTSASGTPDIAGNTITKASAANGWNAVSHLDQRRAGTGAYANTQFSLEPPDQGLCAGNGRVVEAVNNAYRVYDTAGATKTATIPLSQFFLLAPEIVRNADGTFGPFGPFISDPKCYFDPDSNRWFLTELELEVDATTGNFTGGSDEVIGVSTSADPTGTWSIYTFDTTDAGRTGCGCFGDQPLIGADANGFYISTNEYGIFTSAYYGAQLYAISKAALASGASSPLVTHIDAGPYTMSQGGLAYTVQPATSPASGYETANNGTEFFLSTTDWSTGPALGIRAMTIEVWALTNTASLATGSPAVTLSNIALDSELYAQPPNAVQAPGPTPLADALKDHLELVDTNDDRMNQVVYAAGKLWGAANTAVQPPNGPVVAGIAYFIVSPSDATGTLSATMAGQGYVGGAREDVMFPSIGVTAGGKAVMAFSLVGPDFHPSAAYTTLSVSAGAGDIHIAALGELPDDGFSGYRLVGGSGHGRWGDYSAAVADLNGNVWMATEWIKDAPRTFFANWNTFVYKVTP
jgi:hypothetical protein